MQYYLDKAGAKELGVESEKHDGARNDGCAQCGFDWPGNVRQLVNATRRMVVTAPGNEIRPEDVPAEFGGASDGGDQEWVAMLSRWATARLAANGGSPLLEEAQPEFDRTLIRAAMQAAGGRKQDAAKLLGWGRNTLARKMKGTRPGIAAHRASLCCQTALRRTL